MGTIGKHSLPLPKGKQQQYKNKNKVSGNKKSQPEKSGVYTHNKPYTLNKLYTYILKGSFLWKLLEDRKRTPGDWAFENPTKGKNRLYASRISYPFGKHEGKLMQGSVKDTVHL